MKKLKIAIINESWTAGATRCAKDLEHHLSSCYTVRYYPRNGKPETIDSLLSDLTSFAPDVVHCHSYYGDLPYNFLARISHLYPTCFTPHDPRPIGTIHSTCWECPHAKNCLKCPLVNKRHRLIPFLNKYFRQRLYKRYIHWRTAKNLRIVSPSQWLKKRLQATELSRFSLCHIPYGIDLEHFYPVSQSRSYLGLPAENPIILFIAHADPNAQSFNPRKGLKYVADAFFNIILPKYSDAILMIAGESVIPNHPNIKPLGKVSYDKLPIYYSAADILTVASIVDNLPYTVLEAMGCGTPVVGSRIGGISEEIEEGVTGYLVPPADSQSLGTALLSIIGNREKQEKMSQASRARAESLFNMKKFIQKHEELYQTIIN